MLVLFGSERERERESFVFWVGVVFGLEMIGLDKVFFSTVGKIFLRLVRCRLTTSSWFGLESGSDLNIFELAVMSFLVGYSFRIIAPQCKNIKKPVSLNEAQDSPFQDFGGLHICFLLFFSFRAFFIHKYFFPAATTLALNTGLPSLASIP